MADSLVNEGEDVGVVDTVDLPAPVGSDGDQVDEAEFGEVLADGGDGGADLRGQGGDVAVAPLSEQPQDATLVGVVGRAKVSAASAKSAGSGVAGAGRGCAVPAVSVCRSCRRGRSRAGAGFTALTAAGGPLRDPVGGVRAFRPSMLTAAALTEGDRARASSAGGGEHSCPAAVIHRRRGRGSGR